MYASVSFSPEHIISIISPRNDSTASLLDMSGIIIQLTAAMVEYRAINGHPYMHFRQPGLRDLQPLIDANGQIIPAAFSTIALQMALEKGRLFAHIGRDSKNILHYNLTPYSLTKHSLLRLESSGIVNDDSEDLPGTGPVPMGSRPVNSSPRPRSTASSSGHTLRGSPAAQIHRSTSRPTSFQPSAAPAAVAAQPRSRRRRLRDAFNFGKASKQ